LKFGNKELEYLEHKNDGEPGLYSEYMDKICSEVVEKVLANDNLE
jgi:hypothetical protein